jgi:NADH-quinone oxidoreductase subunit E
MSKDLNDMLPKVVAGAVNLFVHPVAGAAALSALGVGMASHAFGVWMGALSGAAEVSQRLFNPVPDAFSGSAEKVVSPKVSKTEDHRQPRAADKPAMPDDLKAISGVGPKLEQVLNGLGIWSYGQIAAWQDAEIAWMDDTLGFNGRIGRDEWIGQATALARATEH